MISLFTFLGCSLLVSNLIVWSKMTPMIEMLSITMMSHLIDLNSATDSKVVFFLNSFAIILLILCCRSIQIRLPRGDWPRISDNDSQNVNGFSASHIGFPKQNPNYRFLSLGADNQSSISIVTWVISQLRQSPTSVKNNQHYTKKSKHHCIYIQKQRKAGAIKLVEHYNTR